VPEQIIYIHWEGPHSLNAITSLKGPCDKGLYQVSLRAIVRLYEYEDWPRGRIVFDRSRDVFIIYADRKLLIPATIARIETQFHLPEDRTEVTGDLHYTCTIRAKRHQTCYGRDPCSPERRLRAPPHREQQCRTS